MEKNVMLALNQAGVNAEQALDRLGGNAPLYKRVLYKFTDDKTFSMIEPALQQEDFETVLSAAHTLKGVAANLGMERLADACDRMVVLLRSGRECDAAAVFPEIKEAYDAVYNVLAAEETL